MSLELSTENETSMKAIKQASEGTPFNDDDQCKRIMDYDLRVCTWNILTLNRDGASTQLAKALIECRADITVIQEMRWMGQGCKSQEHSDIYYSCHAESKDDAVKEAFFANLEDLFGKCPAHDIKIVP